jgi:drug/metabolite transporter (DMT)-like permease
VAPTEASLLLSLETVFSVIGGWLILGEVLSGRELVGCLFMLMGIVISQIQLKKQSNH